MTALYNDIDGDACDTITNAIAAGLITPGRVDRRSIADLEPADLADATRAHLFAGAAGWEFALRLAGWPDDRPVWTASCPCQPFSSAGKRTGTDDERHLWPEAFRLIRACRPATVFGEQVASGDGLAWLDGVFADLESEGYTCRAEDLCAAGVGAPHIRQRLFWVADAEPERTRAGVCDKQSKARKRRDRSANGSAGCSGLELAYPDGRSGQRLSERRSPKIAGASSIDRGLVNASGARSQGLAGHGDHCDEPGWLASKSHGSTAQANWHGDIMVRCVEPTRDGGEREVWRRAPLEPRLFPLAHGIPTRAAELHPWLLGVADGAGGNAREAHRGARRFRRAGLKLMGNAIVVPLAARFVADHMERAEKAAREGK